MLKHECPEEEIICSNEGCSLIIKQKDKEMHAKVCLYKDKNALRMRTGVAIASFTWAIDGFKECVAEKNALSQSVPFANNEFHWDGERWRMLLFVKPPICKMYVLM
ncbi:hypothetical protein P5673_021816 [Acropora cervicornis]|uniref:TRAF-type domain-containing protein n=1 Tax=Acropora cervicornis TaxID=6130 RepID=A0AAD9Q7J6_ACRCE|nr:hypothetical protein P5673_021816 [Acropora cervicornis]